MTPFGPVLASKVEVGRWQTAEGIVVGSKSLCSSGEGRVVLSLSLSLSSSEAETSFRSSGWRFDLGSWLLIKASNSWRAADDMAEGARQTISGAVCFTLESKEVDGPGEAAIRGR